MPLFCLVFLAIFSLFTGNIGVSGQSMDEYQIKSGILYRICKYTRWPQPADPDKPFIISILGNTTLDKEIIFPPNETIDKRKIITRKITELPEINGSEVLFIAGSEAYRIGAILDYLGSKPILTVSDTDGFGEKGVIINFYIQMNKVRFEINFEASRKANLKMHSQLFAIGQVVKTRGILEKDGMQ